MNTPQTQRVHHLEIVGNSPQTPLAPEISRILRDPIVFAMIQRLGLFLSFSLLLCAAPGALAQDTFQVGNTTLTATNVASGIQLPWEILWGPDDFLWVTTRPGTVYRIDPESGETSTVLTKSVTNNGSGEPGMLGMAMHPEWETTPKVFIVYTTGSTWSGTERLSVFDWNGSALVNEEILLTLPAGASTMEAACLCCPTTRC